MQTCLQRGLYSGSSPRAHSFMGVPWSKQACFPSTLHSPANESKLTKAAISGRPLHLCLVFFSSCSFPRSFYPLVKWEWGMREVFLFPFPWGLGTVPVARMPHLGSSQPCAEGSLRLLPHHRQEGLESVPPGVLAQAGSLRPISELYDFPGVQALCLWKKDLEWRV